MPFIPHTDEDVAEMLATIDVDSIETLFDEIPQGLRSGELAHVPEGGSEMAVLQLMRQRAALDDGVVCFAGAGCYDHHIPAAVWDITARGEFMTAYTPYQAEASQGTLQLIYEYQSMMTALTGLDVSNASVYDGGSGLGEAILMAIRGNKKAKSRKILVAGALHPLYRQAAENIVSHQNVDFEDMPLKHGLADLADVTDDEPIAAVVVQQPNYLGLLEAVDAITDWAHARGALVIAVVNPMSLAVLKPPGQWGETGADIACGDGQCFGIPMSSGGPSFGFMCSTQALVRQLPGRIIGRTVDLDGKTGYALTLQAREQHIRRAKATSNICTNQGLLVTAATIHMALMGPQGLRNVAAACMRNTRALVAQACALPGVELTHDAPYFHEAVLTLSHPAQVVRDRMLASDRILAGVPLDEYMPAGHPNQLLVCATEQRSEAEIAAYTAALSKALEITT